ARSASGSAPRPSRSRSVRPARSPPRWRARVRPTDGSRKGRSDVRYMLLIYKDEKRWGEMPTPEKVAVFEEAVAFSEDLRKRGVYLAGDPLHTTSTATTVRMKHGKTLITDGPFAETKEQLGGYSIIEAENLDEALAVAARNPLLRGGLSIEVRPIRVGPPT